MKSFRLALATVFFSGLIFGVKAQPATSVNANLVRQGRLVEAKENLKKSISSKTATAETYYLLGEVFLRSNAPDSALFYLIKGQTAFPIDPWCYLGAGRVKYATNNDVEAGKMFTKAIDLSGYKNASIYAVLAENYFVGERKNYDLAMQNIQKAKELDSKLPLTFLVLGDLKMSDNKINEAASEYENVLYFDKTNAEANFKVGKIYNNARNSDMALQYLENAIKTDSLYAEAHKVMGDIFYERGRYAKARDSYAKYLACGRPTTEEKIRYASVLFFNKEYQASLDEINKILATDSKNIVLQRLRAYNMFEVKDYQGGLKAMDEFMANWKEEKRIATDYEYYGKLLGKNSKDSLAIVYFQKTMQMDSTRKDLYENIASAYDKQKKFDKSSATWQLLISSKKQPFTSDYFQLGRALYNAGSGLAAKDSLAKKDYFVKADTAFGVVIAQSPESQLGYVWRARVNASLDPETTKGLAKPYYEKAIVICEKTPEKYKKELMEAYKYMGFYFFVLKDYETSKQYWNKILAIDPNDAQAKEVLKNLK